MFSETIRRKFLHYFKNQAHEVIPSSAVIPHDDPSLLFANAGMNQFKDLFLGKSHRDYKRAATSQKCIRAGGKHNDLENVGHTSRHLTFFEMLGNFSFGDYFKKEAITFAWEVVTKVFEFDPKYLWATVFYEDEESFALWRKYFPEDRIVRMGEKDNFWSMGETGPCGPCSELLYDRGHHFGAARNPAEDTHGERFFEFWNLVFMEFNRRSDGILERLPKQSVDTGAGLERVVSLKMGTHSLFETDILRELIAGVEKVFHCTYDSSDQKNAPAFRVIADHLRSLSFAIADGAQPSNIERGYVLRKILRRAVRYGRMLGQQEPFLAKILPRLISCMGDDYPELKESENRIAEILTAEEENFFRTLKRGGNMLQQVLQKAHQSHHVISGEDCFKLKDTYGLPLEEISLLAIDSGLELDLAAYQRLESEAKERSRGAKKESTKKGSEEIYKKYLEIHGPTLFVGYEKTSIQATVTALIKEGLFVDCLNAGDHGFVCLNETPFYPEKGGQIGDQGQIENFEVTDCLTPYPDVIIHVGELKTGSLKVGDTVSAHVNTVRRQKIANNHTATHLLHYVLQQVLGPHVKQAGSVVEPSRLRFDFNHHKSLTVEELSKIEDQVNELIRANAPVKTYELSYDEVITKKEIKQFFGEKYGRSVRVVDIDASKELCGGTHTTATGTIGYFKILKESSISAGVRRIEAVTGQEAESYVKAQEEILLKAASLVKVQPLKLLEKLESHLTELKELELELASLKKEKMHDAVNQLLAKIKTDHHVVYLVEEVEGDLKESADLLFAKMPSLALALFKKENGKCFFLFKVSSDLVKQGLHAHEWMKEAASLLNGKGGGRPDSAQGAGDLKNLEQALNQTRAWIEKFSKRNS